MELAFERIEGADPKADILFLHGILGRGANLRSLAKRFVAACPGWSAVLLDLRGHGASAIEANTEAPRATLVECARDITQTTAKSTHPTGAVVGHSFGGKVALELARTGTSASRRSARHYVIVDSLPGPREAGRGSETTLEVLETLAALPGPFPTRQAFIGALVERGLSRSIAEWLGTNLRRGDDGFAFGIDLDLVRGLLDDYFTQDLWPVAHSPAHGAHIHLVIGTKSTVFDERATERARQLEAEARVTIDTLDAGHWVHVEAADALLEVLVRRIGPASALAAEWGAS